MLFGGSVAHQEVELVLCVVLWREDVAFVVEEQNCDVVELVADGQDEGVVEVVLDGLDEDVGFFVQYYLDQLIAILLILDIMDIFNCITDDKGTKILNNPMINSDQLLQLPRLPKPHNLLQNRNLILPIINLTKDNIMKIFMKQPDIINKLLPIRIIRLLQ